MKDKEMAEEWWNNWTVKDWNDIKEGKRLFIQAFLAGLKAGRQPVEEAAEIIRELGGIVREGVTCHRLTDCEIILHRATLFLKEADK